LARWGLGGLVYLLAPLGGAPPPFLPDRQPSIEQLLYQLSRCFRERLGERAKNGRLGAFRDVRRYGLVYSLAEGDALEYRSIKPLAEDLREPWITVLPQVGQQLLNPAVKGARGVRDNPPRLAVIERVTLDYWRTGFGVAPLLAQQAYGLGKRRIGGAAKNRPDKDKGEDGPEMPVHPSSSNPRY